MWYLTCVTEVYVENTFNILPKKVVEAEVVEAEVVEGEVFEAKIVEAELMRPCVTSTVLECNNSVFISSSCRSGRLHCHGEFVPFLVKWRQSLQSLLPQPHIYVLERTEYDCFPREFSFLKSISLFVFSRYRALMCESKIAVEDHAFVLLFSKRIL